MAASFGSEGAESANAIAPPAAPGKASSSSGEIDFKDEAKIRGMELISCTRVRYSIDIVLPLPWLA